MKTAKTFNAQFTGSVEFEPDAPAYTLQVENNLNRVCKIHNIPMKNLQHPMKPLGVIMAQICPECEKAAERNALR